MCGRKDNKHSYFMPPSYVNPGSTTEPGDTTRHSMSVSGNIPTRLTTATTITSPGSAVKVAVYSMNDNYHVFLKLHKNFKKYVS